MKISAVVTVYNTAPYLRRCLDSIINQNFKDMEIIIVNDGSTDNSMDIIKEYCDPRVRVFDTPNRGVSAARNTGMENARGEWIIFVDSDDFWYPDTIGKICPEASDVDFSVCNFRRVFDTREEEPFLALPKEQYLDAQEIIDSYFGGMTQLGEGVCNKLFRRDFIAREGVIFEPRERIFGEDNFFVYKLMRGARKIAVKDVVLYGYYQRGDSATHSLKTNFIRKCRNFMEEMEEYHSYRHSAGFKVRAFRFYYDILYNEAARGYTEFLAAVHDEYFRKKIRGMSRKSLTRNQKLILILLRFPRILYSILKKRGEALYIED